MWADGAAKALELSERLHPRMRFWARAVLIALLAFFVHLAIVTPAAERLAPGAIDAEAWSHSWFYSDPWRVIESQTTDTQLRNNVHPFYGIVTNPPTRALMAVTGLSPHEAVMAVQRAIVFAMLLALTTLLARLKHRTLDIVLGALLVATSASLLFFTSVAETFAWGALSIFLALHILHRPDGAPAPGVRTFAAAGLVSLGMTITNWMSALIGLIWEKSWLKRALVVGLTLLGAVLVIIAQKLVFADSPTPSIWLINEAGYVSIPDLGLLLARLESFFLYAQIAPAPIVSPPLDTVWSPPVLNMLQPLSQALGNISPLGWLGWAAWAGLLSWAALRFVRRQARARTMIVLALFVLFQCALHLIYGESPFLYALHFTPFLAVFALEAMRDAAALKLWIARALAALAILAAIPSNQAAFDASLARVEEFTPEALRLRAEMARRPADFADTPRGHVFIGALNAPVAEKGVVAPGGGFSPAPGSFGLSVLRLDAQGAAAARVGEPLSETLTPLGAGVGYRATTALGAVEITPLRGGAWRYRFVGEPGGALAIDLRGFGPAAGPLTRIARVSEREIVLNHAWRLSFAAPPRALVGRDEQIGGAFEAGDAFGSESGWAQARVVMARPSIDLVITPEGRAAAESATIPLRPAPTLDLNDAPFADALRTQVLTLAASVTSNETRPYDPLYADGAWPQDTAYTAVALAASGNGDLAKAIIRAALPRDFYGDHISEAHAPGLSLWALDQVARRTGDEESLREAWPHVLRKVDLMARCANPDVRGLFSLSDERTIWPRHRYVCGPPLDGLVTGEIGLQLALSHATAFTQAGYSAAARIAETLGHPQLAQAWREEAQRLRDAWNVALAQSGGNRAVLDWAMHSIDWLGDDLRLNMKVLAQSRGQYVGCFSCNVYFEQSALWPTWTGAPSRSALTSLFAERHAEEWGQSGPSVRYAEPASAVAMAHQLLYVGETEAARARLDWFLANTQAPHLAQWGATAFNETPRGAWASLRAAPPAEQLIQPHYWTAAEMAMLQLDMLAYVEPIAGREPVLHIGAGSTPAWRGRASAAGPIMTELGPVCWRWDGRSLRVSAPEGVRLQAAGVFAGLTPERARFACGA